MDRIGLIAGNGRFPLLFAQGARELRVEVIAAAHEGETRPELAERVAHLTWVKIGEFDKIVRTFHAHGVRRAVMAGGIRKAALFEGFAPDERALALLSRMRHFGDDALLRGVAEELEREGIAVVESTLFLGSLLAPEGVMTARALTDQERSDVEHGMRVARAVGGWDIGQSVVVKAGVVLAVEAIEGTDAAVRRGAELGRGDVVVVKASKPAQDLRFDVPAVGLDTVNTCRAEGVRVLAVEAGKTLMLDKEAMIAAANDAGMTIVGVAAREAS